MKYTISATEEKVFRPVKLSIVFEKEQEVEDIIAAFRYYLQIKEQSERFLIIESLASYIEMSVKQIND